MEKVEKPPELTYLERPTHWPTSHPSRDQRGATVPAHKFTKQELKQDSFVDTTQRVLTYGQQHATLIGVILLVIVVVAVGGSYLKSSRENAAREASALLFEGQTLATQGDDMGARGPLEDCIELHGGSIFARTARLSLIQVYLNLGQPDQALALADESLDAVSGDPTTAEQLTVLRAHALAANGQYGEAADAMATTIGDDTPDMAVYQRSIVQAEWLMQAGQPDLARVVLEQLDEGIRTGQLEVAVGNDLTNRLGVARALAP